MPASQSGSSRAATAVDASMRTVASAAAWRSATDRPHRGVVADVQRAAAPRRERAAQVRDREEVVRHAEGVEPGLDAGLAEDVPGEHREQRLLHVELVARGHEEVA